jgi:hypothetical protein
MSASNSMVREIVLVTGVMRKRSSYLSEEIGRPTENPQQKK